MNREQVSKTMLVILALGVVAVIGFVVYSHRSVKNITPAVVSENTPLSPTSWPSTKVSDQTINDNSDYYTITAVYPIVKDNTTTGYFKTFVQDTITQFKSDVSWAADGGASVAPAEAGDLSLDIKYTEQKSDNADNYTFSTTEYSGGAHGLASTKTFTFSPTGQLVTLNNLFTNGSAGLSEVAPYVKKQLAATLPKSDQAFLSDGTAPTADNYGTFTVQSGSITFIFDPYQVAPYSDGQQKVTVPLAVFKDIANPDLFK